MYDQVGFHYQEYKLLNINAMSGFAEVYWLLSHVREVEFFKFKWAMSFYHNTDILDSYGNFDSNRVEYFNAQFDIEKQMLLTIGRMAVQYNDDFPAR
jgi:hypothetical protein